MTDLVGLPNDYCEYRRIKGVSRSSRGNLEAQGMGLVAPKHGWVGG